jgi:hypothetical protein
VDAARYVVKIHYREPTYALSRGLAEKVYSGSFEVSATDPNAAVAHARAEFERIAVISGVSWARQIERIEVAEKP